MRAGTCLRAGGMALLGLVCSAAPVRGQIQAGNEVVLNLEGSVSAGYTGAFSNQGPSTHGIGFGGNGTLDGSYHSPQFLSFDISPFYNQSRNNSNFQSITDSSGVVASANIFGGSQFPGYFNFTKIFNGTSIYAIPGINQYATNGNNQTFGVGWSANFKTLPSLTVGYQQGSSDYSIYGAQTDSLSNFHSVFGNAIYTIDGFHLSGGVHYSNAGSLFPQLVGGQAVEKASSDTTTYTLGMGRSLPWSGTSWANFTRTTSGFNSLGLSSSETADILTGGVALKPTPKLSTQFSADYNDNLTGTIFQSITSAGAITPLSVPGTPSHSWGVFGGTQYSILSGLYVSGTISHRQQLFLGTSYDSTAYSGSVNFGHGLLGGQLTSGATVSESFYGNNGESMLGLLTDVIYIRSFGEWNVSGSFNYSRNVQTILIAYTSAGYGYSVSVYRRVGRLNWTGSASGSKSLLLQASGSDVFAQSYSTGLSGRWLGVSAGYSKSSGTGLFTPSGITVLPPGIPPSVLATTIFYGGRSYSVGVGSTPVRGLTINATYLNALSNTQNGALSSNNKTAQANAYLNYKFRKVYFTAGYSRLVQGFSASPLAPAMVSTFYFGISRWFKAF